MDGTKHKDVTRHKAPGCHNDRYLSHYPYNVVKEQKQDKADPRQAETEIFKERVFRFSLNVNFLCFGDFWSKRFHCHQIGDTNALFVLCFQVFEYFVIYDEIRML